MLRTGTIVVGFAMFLSTAPALSQVQTGAIWIGPNVANWYDSTFNWDCQQGFPNNNANFTFWVLTHPGPVGNGDTITINQNTTIDKGAISYSDTVRLPNGRSFTVITGVPESNTGIWGGGGIFSMESTGALTDFRLLAGPPNGYLILGGDINYSSLCLMSNNPNNRIYGITSVERLVVGSYYTIRGAGQIGVNQTRLTLHDAALIDAVHSNALTINLAGTDNFNQGVLQGSQGAHLVIADSTIDNTGGVIRALDGSFVDLAGTATFIHGGEFTTQGSGLVRVIGNTVLLADFLNSGHMVANNGAQPVFYGTVTNNGLMDWNSTGAVTDFRLDSNVMLTGIGVMNLSDNSNNRFYGLNAERRLTNDADHTIRGSGQLGVNQLFTLTNNGLI